MRVTLSVIKADIGGYVGRSSMPTEVLDIADKCIAAAKKYGLLIDYHVTGCGDAIQLIMTYQHGVPEEKILKPARDTFVDCTKITKKLKLHGAGQYTLANGCKPRRLLLEEMEYITMPGMLKENTQKMSRRPNYVALEGLDESSQDHGGRQSKNPEANVPHLREFMKFSMRWDRRVFIGGSHGLSPVIELIRDKVQRLGYEPILAADFYQPREITIYHKCLALLHSCKYAVIDLSEHAGQLLELERTHEYGVRPLVLWPKNKTSAISQMLTSVFRNRGIKYQSYENYDELDNLLREFFHGDAIF